MRFDDRLLTVLRHSAATSRDRAVQWRQLVELVSRGAGAGDEKLRRESLERIAELGASLAPEIRAAGARGIAGSPVPSDLLRVFVADQAQVAAPLLSSLPEEEAAWGEFRASASAEVATLMDAMRPKAPPEPEQVVAAALPTIPPPAPAIEPVPDCARQTTVVVARSGDGSLFRWECGPTGEIDWVEGAPRAALIGRSIAEDLDRRFAARLPFEDELLPVAPEGVLAGDWRWSGSPAFFPDTGRFAGYRGIARREGVSANGSATGLLPQMEPDQLRELVHELRTPLNAIIGFGEIIDGQFLGPAHRAYRSRAAEIVGHARRLLAAVEDLDLAAKLQSGRRDTVQGSSVEEFFPPVRSAVVEEAGRRGIVLGVTVKQPAAAQTALPSDLAARLIRRFIDAVLGAAAAGERLDLVIEQAGHHLAFALGRPHATAGAGEDRLLDAGYDPDGKAALGFGFALRLVRGLAAIAGGRLEVAPDRLILLLPLAKG